MTYALIATGVFLVGLSWLVTVSLAFGYREEERSFPQPPLKEGGR